MKVKLLFVIGLVFTLSSCSDVGVINEEYGYTLHMDDFDGCDDMIEEVYNDGEYMYYFDCIKSTYYRAENEDGDTFSIYELIQDELLTIDEVYDLFKGELIRREITAGDFNFDDRPDYSSLHNTIYYVNELGDRIVITDPSIDNEDLLIENYQLVGLIVDTYIYYHDDFDICTDDVVVRTSELGNGFILSHTGSSTCIPSYILVKNEMIGVISANNTDDFSQFEISPNNFCKVGYCWNNATINTEE